MKDAVGDDRRGTGPIARGGTMSGTTPGDTWDERTTMDATPSTPAAKGPDTDEGTVVGTTAGTTSGESSSTTGPSGQAPAELTPWVHALAAELGIDPADVPTGALLRLTRDVAHAITRPAGPVTTYLMGVAIARGASYEDAAAQVQRLIERWDERGEGTARSIGPDARDATVRAPAAAAISAQASTPAPASAPAQASAAPATQAQAQAQAPTPAPDDQAPATEDGPR